MNVTFTQDAGHGWFSVARKDIITLSIAAKITGFSYMTNTRVYLEEDLDASLFFNAAKEKGIEVKVRQGTSWPDCSYVRYYPGFSLEWFNKPLEEGARVKMRDTERVFIVQFPKGKNNKALLLNERGEAIYTATMNKILQCFHPID